MTSVLALPSELVDRILGYDNTSYLSLHLWLTGNRGLQDVLARSVSYIELQDAQRASPCRLPKYLVHMRSLRHLVIDRSELYALYHVYDLERTVEVVKGLAEKLESLVFLFRDSSELFFPHEATATPDSPLIPHIPLATTFPSLKCLILDTSRVWTLAMASQLPSSLTDLGIRVPADDAPLVRSIMQVLPPTLARLDFKCASDVLLGHYFLLPLLPPNLVSVRLNMELSPTYNFLGSILAFGAADLALLPRSLTQVSVLRAPLQQPPFIRAMLDVDFPMTPIRVACSTALPPFVSSLNIAVSDARAAENALRDVPTHIETLSFLHSLMMEDKIIRTLPRRLTQLESVALKLSSEVKPADFPPQLRYLEAVPVDVWKPKTAARLPPLVELRLHGPIKLAAVSSLPRTLTRLRIQIDDLEGVDALQWPPHLRTLDCFGSTLTQFGKGIDPKKAKKIKFSSSSKRPPPTRMPDFPCCILKTFRFAPLPRSLTSLNLGTFGFPISELLHLPPFLTKLRLDYLAHEELFDLSSAVVLSRARELLRMDPAGDSSNYDFCIFGQQPQATVFDLIPRTVTDLCYHGDLPVPPVAWSRLPRRLIALHLVPEYVALSSEILLHIPMQHLKVMWIGAIELNGEHVKALPPRMKRVVLAVRNAPPPSAEAANVAPITLLLNGKDMSVSPLGLAIQDRLTAISTAAENRDFQALKDLQPPYPPL